MIAARAAVLKFEADVIEQGRTEGWKEGKREGYRDLLADAWRERFGAPLARALAVRVAAVENLLVLRQAVLHVIHATDVETATREVKALLARS